MTTTQEATQFRVGQQIDHLSRLGPHLPVGTALSHYGTDLRFVVEPDGILHRYGDERIEPIFNGGWVEDRWTIESLPDSDVVVIDSVEEPPDRNAYLQHISTDEAFLFRESDGDWEQRIRTIALGRTKAHITDQYDTVCAVIDEELERFQPYVGMVVHPYDTDLIGDLPHGTTLYRYGLRVECPQFSVYEVRHQGLRHVPVTKAECESGLLYIAHLPDDDAGPPEDFAHSRDGVAARIAELCMSMKSQKGWCEVAEQTLDEMGLPLPGDLVPDTYTPEGVREMPEGSVVRFDRDGYSRLFVRDDSMDNPARTRGIGWTFGDWSSAPVTLAKASTVRMWIRPGSVTELESMPLGTLLGGGGAAYEQREGGWTNTVHGWTNSAVDFLNSEDWHYTHIPSI